MLHAYTGQIAKFSGREHVLAVDQIWALESARASTNGLVAQPHDARGDDWRAASVNDFRHVDGLADRPPLEGSGLVDYADLV